MITAKDAYLAGYADISLQSTDYGLLSDESQAFYRAIANVLNRQHIDPLEGEIEALREMLRECMTMLNGALSPCIDHAETHAWCAKRDDLDARVKAALGEEAP